MLAQCPECQHGTKSMQIFTRRDQIRVVILSDSCGCDISTIGRLRLASAALRQQALEMERTAVAPASDSIDSPSQEDAYREPSQQRYVGFTPLRRLSSEGAEVAVEHDVWNPMTSTYEAPT